MILESLVVGPLDVNCYVLACEETKEGIVVDPGDNVPGILELVRKHGIRVVEVVATHGHFDHIGRVRTLVKETGAPFSIHRADLWLVEEMPGIAGFLGVDTDPAPEVDRFLEEGDTVRFGREALEVLHTPGHAPGNVTLVWPGHAMVGDVLFAGAVGRTDMEGGDMPTLLQSIRQKLFPLGDETVVHPGHGPETTVGRERRSNPFLTGAFDLE